MRRRLPRLALPDAVGVELRELQQKRAVRCRSRQREDQPPDGEGLLEVVVDERAVGLALDLAVRDVGEAAAKRVGARRGDWMRPLLPVSIRRGTQSG